MCAKHYIGMIFRFILLDDYNIISHIFWSDNKEIIFSELIQRYINLFILRNSFKNGNRLTGFQKNRYQSATETKRASFYYKIPAFHFQNENPIPRLTKLLSFLKEGAEGSVVVNTGF